MSRTADLGPAPAGANSSANRAHTRSGLLYGVGAYTLWGVFPLYFHTVAHVPSLIILCHRIVWSALLLAGIVSVRREWKAIGPMVRTPRALCLLSAGAVLIALNWLIFIYSVASHQVLQASLGYFINPLLSIALGMVFLRERLRGWQWLAVGLAGVAVANLAFRGEGFPWIAVSLACTFGFYGLVRKKVDVNSLHGLLVESSLLAPLAVLVLVIMGPSGTGTPTPGTTVPGPATTFGLLSLSGVITAVPLLMFGAALRRLQLSTIGFLQYIGPTLQFLVAVLLLGESIAPSKLGSFGLCWLAIAVYVVDSLLNRRPSEVADEPE
jgi:chloramphenicol-sensitive protein RarD